MTKFYKAIILTSILSLGIYGAVKAFLTDVEQSFGNRVQASSINLRVGDSDPSVFSFVFNDLKPGIVAETQTFITNDGSIDGNFWFDILVANEQEGENFESETDVSGDGDLSSCAEMKISFIDQSNIETILIDYTPVLNVVGEYEKNDMFSIVDQLVNTDQALMKIYMRADNCGNEVMGDYFDLNFNFYLDQV